MHESYEEEKGLFTFYKEQQKEDDLARMRMKKKGKNKQKKSKRKMKSQMKSIEETVFVITEDNQQDEVTPSPKQAFQMFLKNIKHHNNHDNSRDPSCERAISNRLKTQPNYSEIVQHQNSVRAIKKSKVVNQLSKKYNFVSPKQFQAYSPPSISPIRQLIHACQQNLYREPRLAESDSNKNRDKEEEKRKLMERLRSLQIKNKSNLIISRQSIKLRDSNSQEKHFFNQVASNSQQNTDDKNAYKLLKDALKLPNIRRQITQQSVSPNSSQKKIGLAAKNMPYQRKQLRMKHSNQRRKQFYKLNLMAELTESKNFTEGPSINFIQMGKDYKRQQPNFQEWQLKRKLIKSRLGLQL